LHGSVVLGRVAHLADAHRRTQVGRFDEQRQTELALYLGEGQARGVGAGQSDEGGDGDAGVAQQALADVLVHADRRTQHIRADEGDVGHAQQALQAAILAKGAVDDGEDHIDMLQQLLAGGFHQLPLGLARHHGEFAIGAVQRDQRRVLLVEQVIRGIVQVPAALLVDADQHRLEPRAVERIDNILRRLQRHLMLRRTPTENHPDTQPAHDPAPSH